MDGVAGDAGVLHLLQAWPDQRPAVLCVRLWVADAALQSLMALVALPCGSPQPASAPPAVESGPASAFTWVSFGGLSLKARLPCCSVGW